ncbi:DNA sulfur modification protein DndD [gamma proteobacterium NOR5-3]|nr:DNA sulfur modification protein DndD [gamma proteobacterium NOR5-3]
MLFTELVIHNFGIYRGRHTVDLRPKSLGQPIILFGGLNGGGKTTFLDAMKLVLYGKFAECSNRGSQSYDQYLANTINRHCPPNEGAAIELEFTIYRASEETTIRVKRFWQKMKTVSEKVEVLENDAHNPFLSEHWLDHVDEFIPQEIANLFFFDGEKIEALADKKRSGSIVKTGIDSLLGLNQVSKLESDLDVLDRRRTTTTADVKLKRDIEECQSKLAHLTTERQDTTNRIGTLGSEIEQLENRLRDQRKKLRDLGGHLLENRERNEQDLEKVEASLAESRLSMRELASGVAPILLIEKIVSRAKDQSEREAQSKRSKEFLKQAQDRDKALLDFLDQTNANAVSESIRDWLANDIELRSPSNEEPSYLDTESAIFEKLEGDVTGFVRKRAKELVEATSRLEAEKEHLQQQLAAMPNEKKAHSVIIEIKNLEAQLTQNTAKLAVQKEGHQTAKKQIEKIEEREFKLNTALIEAKYADQKIELMNKRSKLVKQTLRSYKSKILSAHISKLETLIFDSFTSLVRKHALISCVKIDPDTFEITVFDSDNVALPTDRLSAGERQLFAIAILWGLAKASGRPLPSIVDTPLGRLDSQHRTHLVENYFPYASHQVILLSTDEEIDQRYRDKLSKFIGKEYHISYSQEAKTSTITPGYF